MNHRPPLILLSNDDGVSAKGLLLLRDALRRIADVIVVAPELEQSAKSHSITLRRPLRHRCVDESTHATDGTPVDCVYVALHRQDILPRWPDLVVSGINHGANLGSDVFYSGTVAAAREGALRGIPAIAFSSLNLAYLEHAARIASTLAMQVLAMNRPAGQVPLLNVNFPATEPLGIRSTCLGRRLYDDEVTVRRDPRGAEYYWVGGPGAHHHPQEGSDTEAIDAGFISVTPLSIEATQRQHVEFTAQVVAATIRT